MGHSFHIFTLFNCSNLLHQIMCNYFLCVNNLRSLFFWTPLFLLLLEKYFLKPKSLTKKCLLCSVNMNQYMNKDFNIFNKIRILWCLLSYLSSLFKSIFIYFRSQMPIYLLHFYGLVFRIEFYWFLIS